MCAYDVNACSRTELMPNGEGDERRLVTREAESEQK